MIDTAVRSYGQTQAPAMNEQPLGQGGQYAFAPITEHDVRQGYVQQNQAAHERHMMAPQNPAMANQAQAAYEQAQQGYAQAMQQQPVPQQVHQLQQAGQGMEQFAQLAGVHDPTQPAPPAPTQPQIILPSGAEAPADGAGDSPVPVLW